jgi:hypothetical protein
MQAPQTDCPWLIIDRANLSLLSAKIGLLGWVEHAAIKRPTDNNETLLIFRPVNPPNPRPARSEETVR